MNSTTDKADAKKNFVRFGGRLTQKFESPVLLFNFTLMEDQLPQVVEKRDVVVGGVIGLVEGVMEG